METQNRQFPLVKSLPALFDLVDSNPNTNICVLDEDCNIIHANKSWKDFCAQNGGDISSFYVGINYLRLCESISNDPETGEFSSAFASGLRRLIDNLTLEEFSLKYPCEFPYNCFYMATCNVVKIGNLRFIVVKHERM